MHMAIKVCHHCTEETKSPYMVALGAAKRVGNEKVPLCPSCYEDWVRRGVREFLDEKELRVSGKTKKGRR